jgi:hypothetical protein
MTDQEILDEMRAHLLRAKEWATPEDYEPDPVSGWCCIKSTLEAVESGNVGLALTRWDDLMQAPALSDAARNWKRPG